MIGFESGRPWHRVAAEALRGRSSKTSWTFARAWSQAGVEAVYLLYIFGSVPALLVKAWAAGRQSLLSDPATASMTMSDSLLAGLSAITPLLVITVVVSLLWAMVFARVRGRPVDPAWAMTAWMYVLLLPADLPLVLAALGMSFAAVVGQYVFGGSGRYIVSPALLGALFIDFSYPDAAGLSIALTWQQTVEAISVDPDNVAAALAATDTASMALPMLVACIVGVVPLIRARVVSLQLLAGAVLGVFLASSLTGFLSASPVATLGWQWHLVLGGMPLCLAFVITDPTAQALTRGGRWIHGLSFAFIVVTVRLLDPAHPDATLFATLLATLAVPLVDYVVCWRNAARSRGRLVLRS